MKERGIGIQAENKSFACIKPSLFVTCIITFLFGLYPVSAAATQSIQINVPNGHVYWNNGDFITTAFTPSSTITAEFVTMNCLDDNNNDAGSETFEVAITTDAGGAAVIASAQITNNFRNTGGCDEHKYSFDFGDVTLTSGTTYYLRTKVLAGAEVRAWAGATLYYDYNQSIPSYSNAAVPVPNGHVYWNNGDFITTPFSLSKNGTAHFVIMDCLDDNNNDAGSETFEVAITTDAAGNNVIASAQITNNFRNTGGCDEHLYLFDFSNVTLTAGTTYYLRTKVLAGAEVRTWGAVRVHYKPFGTGRMQINVPNGHVYWNNGDFITTSFSRSETITANFVTMNCLDDNINDAGSETFEVAITTDAAGNNVIASAQITNNFRNTGGCDRHKYSFDFDDVTLAGGTTYYLRTKVLAGAEVRAWAGATLYFGYDGSIPPYKNVGVPVPNGHVYWNNGDFITTPFSLSENGRAHFVIMDCLDDNNNDAGSETFEVAITTDAPGINVKTSAQITNNFRNTGGCDEHLYLFDFYNALLSSGTTYYLRTKVLAGAEVRTWGGVRVYYQPTSTAVELSSFNAEDHKGCIEIEWITAAEIDIASFNLHRSTGEISGSERINDDLIPGRGSATEGASYSFIDYDVTDGITYYYSLEDVDLHGNGTMHGPVAVKAGSSGDGKEAHTPAVFNLAQNNPNPFNPFTEIRYDLPVNCNVRLDIYSVLGQRIITLVDGYQNAGSKTVQWNGKDEKGFDVSSGIYFCRLRACNFTEVKKMALLR